ncbi:uncharacterized protein MELLADRAFT_62027 [Melampsora larici-populina 98AG31]|uniref:Uncharacterized protein n=1 Tax=Melampsora larici-populina (strain 98AG31 / pathotype 3-4-7) TaxID=747676 RepID=F4RGZ2_MELLP|nr:uncharacterized protein MELLADRAFT_62027 [Melampsora larici-populina 98AG31]EGG08214.1 hypothetical protein MELLADRAFT_62027 [Melampsora larici-populina 98AG31]
MYHKINALDTVPTWYEAELAGNQVMTNHNVKNLKSVTHEEFDSALENCKNQDLMELKPLPGNQAPSGSTEQNILKTAVDVARLRDIGKASVTTPKYFRKEKRKVIDLSTAEALAFGTIPSSQDIQQH